MGNLNIKILIIHKQPVQGTDKEYTVMTSMRMWTLTEEQSLFKVLRIGKEIQIILVNNFGKM